MHKIVFRDTILADLAAGTRYQIERWPAQCATEVADMFESDEALVLGLGNLRGEFVVRCWNPFYASAAAAAQDFATRRAMLGKQGTLDVFYSGADLGMGAALLSGFEPVEMVGVRWVFRYTFDFTGLAYLAEGTTGSGSGSTGD